MDRTPAFLVVVLFTLIAACAEPSPGPDPLRGPTFTVASGSECPATPDVIVRSWDELRAAVAAASPGDVIAVDGTFEATGIEITTADVTLTCATPGSGLRAPFGFMLLVFAPRVTVERLTLDASAAQAYLAHNDPPNGRFAEDIRLLGNTIICGPAPFCVVAGGFPDGPVLQGALVADNHFTTNGSSTALQFHEVDGARVEHNTFHGRGTVGIQVTNQPVRLGRIAISHNTLAGSWEDPLLLLNTEGAQVLMNTVTCGSSTCLFGVGPGLRGIVVADNRFQSAGSATGIHLQGGIDGARVERNTIVATAPSGGEFLGGIRARDGSDVLVADNVVRGPWGNSIASTNLTRSRFENNRLEGAEAYGVRFGAVLMIDNAFRNNQVTGAGSAGIFAQWACGNTFLGNSLEGNGQIPSAIFEATTGANVLVLLGNKNAVIDNGGGFDCDGDGVGDPNIITGPGPVRRGVPLGTPPAGTEGTTRLR